MTNEEQQKRIQYLYEVKKLSFHQIEQETGIPRKRCSKLYYGNSIKRLSRGSLLDEYRDLISHWFQEHPTLQASQVFERLKDRNVQVSYPSVANYTRGLRKKKSRVYWPLTFLPGEEGQVDWFFITHPHLGKLSGFAFILSHSRHLFAHLFQRHSFEFFIEGHLMAFSSWGGYPRTLLYDNLKSVVLRRDPLTYHPAFSDFARYYGFEIRLCNVAAGNEKGRVERSIRTLREGFFNTADIHRSLPAINQALHQWLDKRNQTIHRATGKPPVLLLASEKLKLLPTSPWLNQVVHPPTRSSKTGLITFDTNMYSIPEYLVGHPVSIHAFCDHIELYNTNGKKVATHPRSFDRKQTFINPEHRSFTNTSSKAKNQRVYTVIKNLDPIVEQFLIQNQQVGENAVATAYYLFRLLKNHARATIISAVRDALLRKSPRLKCIASLLEPSQTVSSENVAPQNHYLLQVDYQPRSLKEYDND